MTAVPAVAPVTAVRDVPRVVSTALRLIGRHWPALLALAFLGTALRSGALWAAVAISDHVPILGQITLVLAPLGYLLPLVAMLQLCRRSLPRLSAVTSGAGPEAATEQRPRRLVDVSVSVLVPFLAVYVSYGLLGQDLQRFRNEAAFDEFNQLSFLTTQHYDYAGRLGIYPAQIALMIVAIAWVLRWSLGRIEHRTRFLALAFVGALLEVYYTGQVAGQTVVVKSAGRRWLDDRTAVHGAEDRYNSVLAHLGWFAHPVHGTSQLIYHLAGSFDAVVVVPIAWLTVGAVVLGHRLAPPPPLHHPVIDRWTKLPQRLRSGIGSLLSDITERFSAFLNGLRLLGRAGVLPMLVFSLVFLLVIRIPSLVSELVRVVVGPTSTDTWLAFSPMEDALGLALSLALTAPLLAAALEWLVVPEAPESELPPRPASPPPTAAPPEAAPTAAAPTIVRPLRPSDLLGPPGPRAGDQPGTGSET